MPEAYVTDTERVQELRKLLAPIIHWYQEIEAQAKTDPDEYDSSYLYDMTVTKFEEFHHGVYQQIIELLK
jgi:hypothetical protein